MIEKLMNKWFIGYGTLAAILLFIFKDYTAFLTVLVFGLAFIYIKRSPTPINVGMVFATAFFFTIMEIIMVQRGVWTYSNPDILGIPFWLFPMWGLVFMFFYNAKKCK